MHYTTLKIEYNMMLNKAELLAEVEKLFTPATDLRRHSLDLFECAVTKT